MPYLIGAFVAMARRSEIFRQKSVMDIGKDVTKILREVLKTEKE